MRVKFKPAFILAVMIIVYVSYFSIYQIARHNAYWTFLDLAGNEQTIWNTSQGRPFAFTLYPATQRVVEDFTDRITTNRLGEHVQPILLLLAIPYALFLRSETLLVLMCLSVGLGAIPMYYIAKRRLQSDTWALLISLAYLLLPAVETANGWDPHGTSFVISCILAALDAADRNKPGWWWFWSILAMGTREDIPFITGWAMVWVVPKKLQRQAFWMLGIGTVWSILNFFVIIPYFSGAPTPFLDFFGGSVAGTGGTDLLSQAFFPSFWIDKVNRFWLYNLRLGLPLLFLYFGDPKSYMASLPLLFINTVSTNDAMIEPFSAHYSVPFIPYLLLGALNGINWLSVSLSTRYPSRNWSHFIKVSLVGTVLAIHVVGGYTPINPFFVWPQRTGQEQYAEQMLALLPENAPASLEMHLAAQDSQREILRIFPDKRDVEWIAFNVWYPGYPYGLVPNILRELYQNENWQTVYAEHGLILLKRAAGPPENIMHAYKADGNIRNEELDVRFGTMDNGLQLTAVDIIPIQLGNLHLCTEWTRLGKSTALPRIGLWNENDVVNSQHLLYTAYLYPEVFQQAEFTIRECTYYVVPVTKSNNLFTFSVEDEGMLLPVSILDESNLTMDLMGYSASIIININVRDFTY
ncbi:MAG: DUF2079 domain-containing protein [Anaerolineae bacterium]|nr:DUF2079 domain-containing protein [Anaerolineae bacterium]